MYLEEFYDYKNKMMDDLLTDPTIVGLLNEDPQNIVCNGESLIYDQVFPYEYVPETVEHAKTYICIDVDVENQDLSKTFLNGNIMVWVFTHKSLMRLPGGGVRVDKLCSEIDKKINGSREYGLGQLNLLSSKRFAIMTDYQGKVLTFYTTEFNKVYDPKKPFPANRRQ